MRVSQTPEDQRFGLDACMAGKAGVWHKMLSFRGLLGTLGGPDDLVSGCSRCRGAWSCRCRGAWLFPMTWCLVVLDVVVPGRGE